ncbi:MAG: SMC family ATPase [Micrococcales bacterium]|nr:SMC family ATPase [Micrococcales bacterium]
MRLHKLDFAGIGPFIDPVEIDFDQLGASGLFLLEGPTGSGKSTVIDAITFALYGRVAAAGADKHRLRSDFADSKTESVVELVFSTGSGVYRVRRTPAFERAKQRGEGTATVQTTVKLWRLNDPTLGEPGELVSSRVQEADSEIERVVKLDRQQFVQTIVLPQGQFADFLQSKPEERREVLQRVFGTERYENWTKELVRRRQEANKLVQGAQTAVQLAAQRLVGAAGMEPSQAEAARQLTDQSQGLPGDLSLLRSQAAAVAQANATKLEQANAQVAAAETALEQATSSLEKSADLAGAWHRRTKLEHQVNQLKAGASQREKDRSQVAAGRRAALVSGPIAQADLATSQLEQTLRKAQKAGLSPDDQVAGAAELQTRVGQAEAEAKAAAEQRVAADQHANAVTKADLAAKALAQLLEKLSQAQQTEHSLREARIAGIAAELAGELTPGQPCPVCGALEHPAPAKPGIAHVTPDQVEKAEAARQTVERRLEKDRLAAEQAKTEVSKLAALSGGLDAAAATAAAQQAAQAAKTALVLAKVAAELETAGAIAETRISERDEALLAQGFESVVLAREAFIEAKALDRLDRQVQADQAKLATLAEQLASGEYAELIGTAKEAETALASATSDRRAKDAELTKLRDNRAVLAKRDQAITTAIKQLDQAMSTATKQVEASQAVIRMANLAEASSGNLRQITLPTFVLMRRFTEVVDAANARLGPMSDHRYRLDVNQGKEATRARRTGLALEVMDQQTGKARDPRTLSGGETFYVSLALALGLADVVKAEAGGINLGTLFIDEGFGSLSDEVLDGVLAELSKLRSGGRMVGVVSHVEALKQAVAERIEVRRTKAGTSTLTIRA